MDEVSLVLIISGICAAILWVVGVVGWLLRRKRKPYTARDPGLVIIFHVVYLWLLTALICSVIPGSPPELIFMVLPYVTSYMNMYLFSGFRLLLIYQLSGKIELLEFNLSAAKLNVLNSSSEMQPEKMKIFSGRKWLSTSRILLLFFAISMFQILIQFNLKLALAEIILYLIIALLMYYVGDLTPVAIGIEVCVLLVLKCLICIGLSIKLYRVQDNFGLKSELRGQFSVG